mgnify:FL=1
MNSLSNVLENNINTFKTIFELSPDPILIIKEDKFVDCNQAAINILGASSKDSLIEINPSKISPEKQPDGKYSYDKASEIFEKVYKDGVIRFEWLHKKIDGSDLFVEVTLTKFEIENNELLHVHWKDISYKKEIEDQLEYSRKRFAEISNISSDWIWEVDKNCIYTYVGSRIKDFLGFEANEIIGKSLFELMEHDESKKVKKFLMDYVSKQLPFKDLINTNIHKNGNTVTLQTSAAPIFDKYGEFIGYRGMDKDITQQVEYEKQIEELAYYDFLTKLPNRKLFQEKVESCIRSFSNKNKKFAILFLDLDNFKWVNDSMGHHFGDKVLIEVGKRINEVISQDSVFSRLGGDEFVLLTPYSKVSVISELAQEIIKTVKDPVYIDNMELNVGWSIGISLFPEHSSEYNTLLKNSDMAMYEAKESGKNNFKYFNESMNTLAHRRLEFDTCLRSAVEKKEFTLVYQPKGNFDTKDILGFEALIRWNDPKLGVITPEEFIPIAEQSGYIYTIGLWVLETAFNDLQSIHKKYNTNKFHMAINISGKQLEDKRFLDDVKYLIKKTEVSVSSLEFEITETALMNNIQSVIPILNELKNIGISLSIDDFGTGYSSLTYLKKMPIDILKIDKEFISELDSNDDDKAIVEATIALAKSLKLKTVAEGVEKIEQSDILKKMDCNLYQGYLYSKPLPIEMLFDFIETHSS